MSANIPPLKHPNQAIADILKQQFDSIEELEGKVADLTALLTGLLVEFARRAEPSPEAGLGLLRKIVEDAQLDVAQVRARRATVRELAELLMRKADPWKPDA